MKKVVSVLLAGIMTASLFGGCSKAVNSSASAGKTTEAATGKTTEAAPAESTEAAGSGEPAKLIVWGAVPEESGPQDLVNAWNAANPDIQVEYVRFVNDDTGNTKLDTALLSGEQIDLYFTYGVDSMKKRVEGGMMEPLSKYGVDSFVKDNITGGMDSIVTIDKDVYAIPTAKEPVGIMLNKNMLDAKGISIPDNWTVDDFKNVAKQLTFKENGKQVYGTTVYYAGLPIDFATPVIGPNSKYTKDGKASNFDAPEYAANAGIKSLLDDGYAMPFGDMISRKLDAYAHPAFLSGEVGMMAFSAWMLRYIQDEENFPHDFVTTFAPIPTVEKGVKNPYQITLNNYLSINSNSKYKEQAWKFMQFWITDGSKYMYKAGKIPVWNQAKTDEITKGILGDNAEKFFDVEAYKKVVLNPDLIPIVDTMTTANPQILQIYKEESEKYFLGSETQEEYLKTLKERCDDAINSELKK